MSETANIWRCDSCLIEGPIPKAVEGSGYETALYAIKDHTDRSRMCRTPNIHIVRTRILTVGRRGSIR